MLMHALILQISFFLGEALARRVSTQLGIRCIPPSAWLQDLRDAPQQNVSHNGNDLNTNG